jgi:hypothetical protein
MGPSTPLRREGAEGHPTGLEEGDGEKKEGRGEGGRGGQEGLVQEASVVGQASLSGLEWQ